MKFFDRIKELTNLKQEIQNKKNEINQFENDIELLKNKQSNLIENIQDLEIKLSDKETTMENIRAVLIAENEALKNETISNATSEAEKIRLDAKSELSELYHQISLHKTENSELEEKIIILKKDINSYTAKARKFRAEVIGLNEYKKKFSHYDPNDLAEQLKATSGYLENEGIFNTIIELPLHSEQSKELKKLATATRKEINLVLEKYKDRYTTKANRTIYKLMIIGLQAELQLLLFKLTYQKIDETKQLVKEIIQKYLVIAGEGNQSILTTLTRFISEIEPLYLELVDIEYKYYIKRQQEKEEQIAIKEQMKQEKEEREALKAERKKLDREESKYKTEIERNSELLNSETDETKLNQLQARIAELQQQLEKVEVQKEEVTSLAMGKAGYVYVISNLGSFGSNVFKIGMTRRLEPQQRIDELGSASVPFKFDVHSMIFSDDAVSLENTLHKRLSENRVNKINFRKEFFKTDIEHLEQLVEEIDPTADFIKTMYAEEYQQTLSLNASF